MVHVGVVTPRYPPTFEGGGERSVQLLAIHLAQSTWVDEVTVFSFDGSGRTTNGAVTVMRLGEVPPVVTEVQNLLAGWKLRDALSSVDLVHAYNMELHPAVGYLCSQQEIPAIGTLNSYHFFPKSVANEKAEGLERLYEAVGHPTTNRLLLKYLKRMDVFIALSSAVKRIYRERGFERKHIHVVPNMLDPSFKMPERDPGGEEYTLLFVGTLSQNKGVQYLIDALTRLPEEYTLRIVGEGEQRETLENVAKSLDVTDRAEFAGWVSPEEIGQEYAAANMFVHPGSWPEPFGRTVLEAMQAGLPVVCSDIGGPPGIVRGEQFTFEPRNAKALAETVREVRNLGSSVGEQNRRYVYESYVPPTVIAKITDIYELVLG